MVKRLVPLPGVRPRGESRGGARAVGAGSPVSGLPSPPPPPPPH